MKKFLFVLLSVFYASAALACTPGAGNGPSGDPNCMGAILNNDPYYNKGYGSGTSSSTIIRHTTVKIPSKYGALAFNQKTGISGGAVNADSLRQAKKLAIQNCENGGKNAPCKVIAWVRNGCIAGAVNSRKQLFKATAETSGQAEQIALNKCQATGSSCEITIPEGCSIP